MDPVKLALPLSQLAWMSRSLSSDVSSSSSSSSSSSADSSTYVPILTKELKKWIKEEMFKKDNEEGNVLYNETGKVNLPVDEEGILILDPVARTRIIDSQMEEMIFIQYCHWILEAIKKAEKTGAKKNVDWLIGLKMATEEDWKTVDEEENTVIDEERKKRVLADGETFLDWRDYGRFNKDEEQDDQTSEESASGSEGPTETKASEENVDEDIVALDRQSPSPLLPLPEPFQAPHSADYDTVAPPLDLFTLWC